MINISCMYYTSVAFCIRMLHWLPTTFLYTFIIRHLCAMYIRVSLTLIKTFKFREVKLLLLVMSNKQRKKKETKFFFSLHPQSQITKVEIFEQHAQYLAYSWNEWQAAFLQSCLQWFLLVQVTLTWKYIPCHFYLLVHDIGICWITHIFTCGQLHSWQFRGLGGWHEVSTHKNAHGCFFVTTFFKLRILCG